MTMTQKFQAARAVGVPLVVVRSADQFAALVKLAMAVPDKPVLRWDAVSGIVSMNKLANQFGIKADDTVGFVEAMLAARLMANKDLPGGVLLALNAHRQLLSQEPGSTAAAVQAVANLRNVLKPYGATLVLFGPFGFKLPTELEQDVVTFDEELPGDDRLRAIAKDLHADAKAEKPTEEQLDKIVEAVKGLSEFAAEQAMSMSFHVGSDGVVRLDIVELWERKRVMIEQTPGLGVYRGKERFADIVGLDNVKEELRQQIDGLTPVGVAVFMDEFDKSLANVEQDTTGVRMDQLKTLLTEMEDNRWRGVVLNGVPGGGKSLLAKAFGNEAGVPTIKLDLGGMEGSLVGESEARLRAAIAVIKAVGGGNAFFIATSNNATPMRPEMQRRFTEGMFYFDLMSETERVVTWRHFMKVYELADQPLPESEGWTGAEIRNCCEKSWRSKGKRTLVQAAAFIVPVAQSRAEEIDRLRRLAHGRFLDASKPGKYDYSANAKNDMQERYLRAIDASALTSH